MNFCVAFLILNVEEKSNIFGISCFIISSKVKMQLKCTKRIYAVYGEGAMTDQTCLQSFVLEISHWMMFHGGVDQLKLTETKLRY